MKLNMNRRVLISLAAILLLIIFCISADVFAGKNDKIRGWAWLENIGWVSMNCYNPELHSECLVDYGVDYDRKAMSLTGNAWSEYGGWLCFGATCKSYGLNVAPDGSAPEARLFPDGTVFGWAAWPVLGADGWVKLSGQPDFAASAPFYKCKNCQADDNVCAFCFTDSSYDGAASICSNCEKCDLNQESCGACDKCLKYGLGVDFSNNTLIGWAWGGDATTKTGFGWMNFHPKFSQTEVHGPYVNVVGDVYSGGNLGSLYTPAAPDGKANATFLLQAGGKIVRFTTVCQQKSCAQEGVSQTLPKSETDFYSDPFGFLDVKGLLAGQYGAREDIKMFGDIDNPLGGQIYYYNGDLYLNNDWVVNNGINGSRGNGTLVVRGNLYINKNMRYQQTPVAAAKELASLGVIVLKKDGQGGNIIIAPEVAELVGNFYAENKISTGGGKQALKVSGLMVADSFSFEREFVDLETKAPAESIVYDGRVLANMPPGFGNIAEGLPSWFGE
jgi:hypothetical protein